MVKQLSRESSIHTMVDKSYFNFPQGREPIVAPQSSIMAYENKD